MNISKKIIKLNKELKYTRETNTEKISNNKIWKKINKIKKK